MRLPGAGSPAGLRPHERAVVRAVARRLPREARKLLKGQVRRVGRVLRPRHVPELCLCSGEPQSGAWAAGALFPRREEFVLARVALRCSGRLHRCEVVAVDGHVFALVTSPPLAGGPSPPVRIVEVEMGADPMDPGELQAFRRPGLGGTVRPGAERAGVAGAPGWTFLTPRPGPGPNGLGSDGGAGVVAVGPGGVVLVGRRDLSGEAYRAWVPGRRPVALETSDLGLALRQAGSLVRGR